jgi:D-serine deaminase-like pyridoxal phosphate-dependent protein
MTVTPAAEVAAHEPLDARTKGVPSTWWGRRRAETLAERPVWSATEISGPACVVRAARRRAGSARQDAQLAAGACAITVATVGQAAVYRASGVSALVPVGEVVKLYDQHANLRLAGGDGVEVGQMLRFGISHPCTTFDRWRLIPELDADDGVVDLIETCF